MRESYDEYSDGILYNGFDYDNQAWVVYGRYVRCGHDESINCRCYGKIHEGDKVV